MQNGSSGQLVKEANSVGIDVFGAYALIKRGESALILRRRKDDDMPGTYGIPGGGVEARETLESALKREVLEETGLKVRKILNYLSYFDITLEKTGRVRNFIFSVDVEPGDVKLTEHESYSWVSSKELNEFKLTKEMKGILEINL